MPDQENQTRRLADLLVDPHETLDVELKGWLDIVGNNEHKAVLAIFPISDSGLKLLESYGRRRKKLTRERKHS